MYNFFQVSNLCDQFKEVELITHTAGVQYSHTAGFQCLIEVKVSAGDQCDQFTN